jgi:hypothetical protein
MEQRRQRSSRWTPEWSPERWLEVLLAMLVLFVFVGRPIVAEYPQADLALEIILTLVLASGVAATTHRGGLTIIVVAVITIAVGWLAWGTRSVGVREIHNAVAMLYCVALAAYVLSEVFRATEVRRHQIEGAIAAYLLLGVAWSFAYNLVFMIRPESFAFGNAMLQEDPETQGRFLYFSFVTLTTIGYGDITPTIATTEMLSVLEALVGQLFPAILLARLVSMELHHRLLREQRAALRRDG